MDATYASNHGTDVIHGCDQGHLETKTLRKAGASGHGGKVCDGLLLALRSPLRRVHGILEVFAGLEADVLRRRNRDLLVGAGVAAFAGLALRDREAAEAGDRATLAAL